MENYLWQILGDAKYPEVHASLPWTAPTNNRCSHLSCQLLTLLMGLQSFFQKVTNMLPLGQRWKVDKVHLLIGGEKWGRQKGLHPIFTASLFYGGNMVRFELMSQILLALFFLLLPMLLFFHQFPGLLFQSCFLGSSCFFSRLMLRLFLFLL